MGIESPIELYQSSVAFNASIFFSKHKTLALVGAIFLFVITSWKDGIKIKALDRLINSIFLKDMPLTTWLYRDFNSTAGFEPTMIMLMLYLLATYLKYGRSRTFES